MKVSCLYIFICIIIASAIVQVESQILVGHPHSTVKVTDQDINDWKQQATDAYYRFIPQAIQRHGAIERYLFQSQKVVTGELGNDAATFIYYLCLAERDKNRNTKIVWYKELAGSIRQPIWIHLGDDDRQAILLPMMNGTSYLYQISENANPVLLGGTNL